MLPHLPDYVPPKPSLWQGRKDSLAGERYFQQVQCMNLLSDSIEDGKQSVILGFCSDEGIKRNSGRPGAVEGPNAIRVQLGKLACHQPMGFLDVGNILATPGNLESAQNQFSTLIAHCHQHGHKTLAFGGGHEIAWPHFLGLASHYPKIGIINFDAHFDLRPPQEGLGTSGTPFWQIQEYCQQNNLSFEYCCLGIQAAANTKSLFERAKEWKVSYLTAEQIHNEGFAWQIAFLDDFMLRHDYLYLSICLDVFAECFAPGVSAPQAIGLTPWQALPLLKYIKQSGKVISLDIAELSPPLDQEQRTARLAAILLAELLNLTNEGIYA
ncbi:formimidoylglutamase [Legionella oakridgensis]|uniref:formimidoylglutamase n=1 Tax=Legionella oakridgensis TaxID=29423 RepID=UPI0003DE16CF|nr:formimidoylglutamase [Legionella oakridgensis]ETO93736.1 formiminoglutamase [Legionella oakridgensis RV-2-2007]